MKCTFSWRKQTKTRNKNCIMSGSINIINKNKPRYETEGNMSIIQLALGSG